MKIMGGYLPKISGRPKSVVEEVPQPNILHITLDRGGMIYTATVKNGQKVKFGDVLAEAPIIGGKIVLPAPSEGKISIEKTADETTSVLKLACSEKDNVSGVYEILQPERATPEKVRSALSRCGVWQLIWSSLTGGIPTLETSERPRAIIVNSVLSEPFRTRGKIILQRSWNRIVQGMKFFPRLLADYGTTEVILTDKKDPVAQRLYKELAGYAWLHFHPVPLLYPVENPIVLTKALRKHDVSIKKKDVIWVVDIQAVEAIGACLAEGVPHHRRIVAVGGPGHPEPKHLEVRVGTPVRHLLPKNLNAEGVLILRGGILKGEPVSPDIDAVDYGDDAFFFLPQMKKREFLSFTRPGFRRTSILPCFMSRITGAFDSEITATLRGERRPCIACGLCEMVCPVELLPQILHRYLYREEFDKAEAMGLDLCVDCGLCTYVCPSKIELQKQFMNALRQLESERRETAISAPLSNTTESEEA